MQKVGGTSQTWSSLATACDFLHPLGAGPKLIGQPGCRELILPTSRDHHMVVTLGHHHPRVQDRGFLRTARVSREVPVHLKTSNRGLQRQLNILHILEYSNTNNSTLCSRIRSLRALRRRPSRCSIMSCLRLRANSTILPSSSIREVPHPRM